MDSTLLYADSLLRQPTGGQRFSVTPALPLLPVLSTTNSRPSARSAITTTTPSAPVSARSDKRRRSAKANAKDSPTDQPAKCPPDEDLPLAKPQPTSFRDMKRKLFSKLFRVLTLKDVTGNGKISPRDYRSRHLSAKRKRARSSQSSALSNYEPCLATIFEDDEPECDLASCQSTLHCGGYETLTRPTPVFVNAAA
ncbi:hypothetical protein M3Y99_01855500 [Aphelenchoides fujianensis]|nr:hypothetical protein M3Y99_01855500 [Aphelenchoides fujianensis]